MQNRIWKLNELIDYLLKEQALPSRFPVRVIFANSLSGYKELADRLVNISDNVIPLSQFCDAPDILPDLDALIQKILTGNTMSNLVLSLGEYLRLGSAVERNRLPRFKALFNIQQQPISTKRLWLPLYCASHLFEELIGSIDIRHENDVFYLEPINSDESFCLKIYSEDFENTMEGDNVVTGIQSWIGIWDEKVDGTQYNLITKHFNMIEESDGIYSVDVISDAYKFISSNVTNADQLRKEWGSNTYWAELAKFTSEKSIDKMLLRALNLSEYEPYIILSSWSFIGDFKKWVMWIWNRIHTHNDYISYAIRRSESYRDIENQIECALFNMPPNYESVWLKQRTEALRCLRVEALSDIFWKEFDKILDLKQRLKYLTDQTNGEKVGIIKVVSSLMRTGKSPEEVCQLLGGRFPELCEYLLPTAYRFESKDLTRYFDVYRIQKLKDEFNQTIQDALENVYSYIWSLPSRGNVLEKYANRPNTALLCIDGMGIEWLGLLLLKIKELALIEPKKVVVSTAKLPTVTEINWPLVIPGITLEKINQLDDISHDKTDSNTAEYSLIITRQLGIFTDFAEKIVKLYSSYKTVIVTADHGLSRMAALSFHQIKGLELPPGAASQNLGRYCTLKDEKQTVSIPNTEREGTILAFRTHQHFSSSGRANGELHGGASPEELLVPVIIFENSNFKIRTEDWMANPITYKFKKDKVKRNASHTVELEIVFNQAISTMEAKVGQTQGSVKQINNTSWSIVFTELGFQKYELQVIADGILLQDQAFSVERQGLQINDDF